MIFSELRMAQDLYMHRYMIRETLEIIPVAAVMAVVLAFGLKAEQSPGTLEAIANRQSERPKKSVEPVAGPPEIICPVEPELVVVQTVRPERDKRTGEIRMRPSLTYRRVPISAPAKKGSAVDAGGRIIINRASVDDLQRIPGIGLGKARVIVQQRPAGGFGSWEELDAVPGVGHGTLEMLRLYADLS